MIYMSSDQKHGGFFRRQGGLTSRDFVSPTYTTVFTWGSHLLNSFIQLGTVLRGTTIRKGPMTFCCMARKPAKKMIR